MGWPKKEGLPDEPASRLAYTGEVGNATATRVPMFRVATTALRTFLLAGALAATAPGALAAQSRRGQRAERLVRRGRALVAAGDAGSALAYFRRAIEVDRWAAEAYAELASVYLAQRRPADALEALQAGLRRCPQAEVLHLLFARTLYDRGARAEAAEVLRTLVALAPTSVAAHRERAAQAEGRGGWSEALGAYRAIVALAADGLEVPPAVLEEARQHIGALRLLTRGTDPVARCRGSEVRAALCAPTRDRL